MLSLLLILILSILINVVTSYVPVRNVKVLHDVSPHSFILKTLSTTEPPPTKKKGFWEEFRDIFFGNYHFNSFQFIITITIIITIIIYKVLLLMLSTRKKIKRKMLHH
jgi:hypothetical protein